MQRLDDVLDEYRSSNKLYKVLVKPGALYACKLLQNWIKEN